VLAGAIMFGILFQIFRINHICCMLRVCGNLKNPCPVSWGLNTLTKKLILNEVIPMGSQVVYVCVGWCDHVWNLISNLSNHSYLLYAASLRKLKKSVSCVLGA
jgi:hypothetical protein